MVLWKRSKIFILWNWFGRIFFYIFIGWKYGKEKWRKEIQFYEIIKNFKDIRNKFYEEYYLNIWMIIGCLIIFMIFLIGILYKYILLIYLGYILAFLIKFIIENVLINILIIYFINILYF